MSKKIELDQIIRNEFYEYIDKNINSNCMPLHGNVYCESVCCMKSQSNERNIDSISECKEILKVWKLNVLMSK